jgi:hypothetical protein
VLLQHLLRNRTCDAKRFWSTLQGLDQQPQQPQQAVDLLDDGDVDGLRRLLADVPSLATQRVSFEGGNYFREPSLLEFVAENPVRHDGLPPNIAEVARTILDAGAHQRLRMVVNATVHIAWTSVQSTAHDCPLATAGGSR